MLRKTKVLHYNYFAHVRTLLFPNQVISLSKKITLAQYIRASSAISTEIEMMKNSMLDLYEFYIRTGDKEFKKKADNFKDKLSVFNMIQYHGQLMIILYNQENNIASFDRLISFAVLHGDKYPLSSDYRAKVIEEEKFLRSTFTKKYFTRLRLNVPV